ncbi:MAG TPA: PEGA domain-containing protein [Vicinamibacterales bacterium]
MAEVLLSIVPKYAARAAKERVIRRLRAEDRGAAIRAHLVYEIVDDTRLSEQDELGSSRHSQPVPLTRQSRTIESVRWAGAASFSVLLSRVGRLSTIAWALGRRLFLASGPAVRAVAARTAAIFLSVAALSRSISKILQRSPVRSQHAVAVLLLAAMTGIAVVTAHRFLEMTPTPWSRESAAAPLGTAAEAAGNTFSTDSPGVALTITKRARKAFGPATAISPQTPADLAAQRPSSSPAVTSKPRPGIAQSSRQSVAAQSRTAPLPNQPATSPARGVPALGGVLSVTSDPAGAEVYVDGRKLFGRTPMAVSGLAEGDHVLRIALDGYDGWSEGVQLVSDQTTRISVRMQPAGK